MRETEQWLSVVVVVFVVALFVVVAVVDFAAVLLAR